MITSLTQRWRDRRGSYRPAGETIETHQYEVASLASDSVAKAFVLRHHYLGSYPAARRRFGLFRGAELVGVAVFSVPANNRALAVIPGDPLESLELGRFVLLDQVPANGESWFLARCFELLRDEGFAGVISFSDPLPRATIAGRIVFGGHVGTIYQAGNATYLGRGTARTLRLLPDGRTLSDRAIQKVRSLERGGRHVVELLRGYGAGELRGDPAAWLGAWLPLLTRPVRHPGNHKYAWALRRDLRRHLPASRPYPKFHLEAA